MKISISSEKFISTGIILADVKSIHENQKKVYFGKTQKFSPLSEESVDGLWRTFSILFTVEFKTASNRDLFLLHAIN